MKAELAVLTVATTLVLLPGPLSANDDGVDAFPTPQGDELAIHGDKTIPGGDTDSGTTIGVDSGPVMEYHKTYEHGICRMPGDVFAEYYQRLAGSGDPWELIRSGCEDTAVSSPGEQPQRPILTPDDVLEAVRRIGLPASALEVPAETLVNYDTTVYAEPITFSRTVTLLGYAVDVVAEPSSYLWVYGDGDTDRTDGGGRPYPADDITHTWTDAHRTFRPRVDTTYAVRYRVDQGPWLSLGDALTVPGPETAVRIREATPMLADMN